MTMRELLVDCDHIESVTKAMSRDVERTLDTMRSDLEDLQGDVDVSLRDLQDTLSDIRQAIADMLVREEDSAS